MTAFYTNRSYIAQNLWENRNNDFAASCAGQCVLKKKLRQLEEPEGNQQQNERMAKVEWLALLPMSELLMVSTFVADRIDDPLAGYCSHYSYLFTQTPFIPSKPSPAHGKGV